MYGLYLQYVILCLFSQSLRMPSASPCPPVPSSIWIESRTFMSSREWRNTWNIRSNTRSSHSHPDLHSPSLRSNLFYCIYTHQWLTSNDIINKNLKKSLQLSQLKGRKYSFLSKLQSCGYRGKCYFSVLCRQWRQWTLDSGSFIQTVKSSLMWFWWPAIMLMWDFGS